MTEYLAGVRSIQEALDATGVRRKTKDRGSQSVKNVLTVAEVSHYLRVHTTTIYRLARKGDLPAFRLGDTWRFNIEDVDTWRLRRAAKRSDLADEEG